MRGPRFVIFDLDGTLIDSALLCASILNEMLSERKCKRQLTVDLVKPHMSFGGEYLVSTMLGADCGEVDAELQDFRRRYAALPTPEASLFHGVRYGLERLSGLGLTMAVCSNKPQELCEKIVSDLGLLEMLPVIVGGRPDREPKPHPQMGIETLEALGATRDECIYVGDSEQDQTLADAIGVDFLLVTYGYPSSDWDSGGVSSFETFDLLASEVASRISRSGDEHHAG